MRVLHLVGSPTSDFYADLSRLYAADCLAAVSDEHDHRIAYVSPDGLWRFPASLDDLDTAGGPGVPLAEALPLLKADVAVPQLFCLAGMTTYRSLLDLLGIPFVGNRADVMAVGADKARTRAIVSAAGVPVPAGEVLRRGQVPTQELPVVVKPVDADNSLGISLVRRADELQKALDDAFVHSERVLVERYVELGREVRCGAIERDGELVLLPLEEYAVTDVRRHDDKVRREDDGLSLVAKDVTRAWRVDPADPLTERVQALAALCHEALGCRDHSLFDFRVDPDGQPFFLEASLYCSYARQSVVTAMAEADGTGLNEMFRTALASAMRRS